MLGLCEGNHCLGGRKGRASGNGRIAVFQLDGAGEDCRCAWTGTSLSLKKIVGVHLTCPVRNANEHRQNCALPYAGGNCKT